MLRMIVSTSAEAAKRYFRSGFSRQDYYTEDQEIVGKWGGKGAEILGLQGDLQANAYDALCDNISPATGERLTQRTKANRRVGYDLNFHVPKSVSVLNAFSGDTRIVAAFREAVQETMQELEAQTGTRVRQNGANFNRITGNLVWAEFIHFTSRPVDGTPDPHLHAHVFTFNATYDPVEKCWKAGQFGDINLDIGSYEADFHNRFFQKLEQLGYTIMKRGKSFEIVGVPDSVLEKFSRRTKLIERVAQKLGITDEEAKAKLGAATREAKIKGVTQSQLLAIWRGMLTWEERVELDRLIAFYQRRGVERERANGWPNGHERLKNGVFSSSDGKAEEEAIQFALKHSFERASVITERRLLETALRFGMGRVDVGRLRAAIAVDRSDLIRKEVNGKRMITTPEVLAEEEFIVAYAKNGKGTRQSIVVDHIIKNQKLSEEQVKAVRHVLESRNRVVAIQGRSGAGKTTLMTETIDAMKKRGHRVMVLAPSSRTAHEVLREEGFENADTVEQFLVNAALQKSVKGGVLWIDEAGQVSSRTMYRLFKAAEELGARVVLSGDTKQHRSVDRGDSFRLLQEFAELPVAKVESIRRQKGIYKAVVEDLAAGRVVEGIEKLRVMGALREADAQDRYKALAAEYLQSVHDEVSALVISPTRSECRKVTDEIRAQLKAAGMLTKSREFANLRRIDLTEAERADWRSYRTGWLLEMVKSTPNHRPGDRYVVSGIERGKEGGLRVFNEKTGIEQPFDAKRWAGRFLIYEEDSISVSVGEKLRITKNGWSGMRRLYNGGLQEVEGFTARGEAKLKGGIVLPKDFKHFDYGYATTSYAAQGATVDRVFIAESSESFGAASIEQFYVSVSRGREFCRIYTDSIEALIDAVEASSRRTSAMEMLNGIAPDHVAEIKRAQQRAEMHSAAREVEKLSRKFGKHDQRQPALIEKAPRIERNKPQGPHMIM